MKQIWSDVLGLKRTHARSWGELPQSNHAERLSASTLRSVSVWLWDVYVKKLIPHCSYLKFIGFLPLVQHYPTFIRCQPIQSSDQRSAKYCLTYRMYADILLFVEESHRAFTCIHFLALSVSLTQSHNVIVSPNKVYMCCILRWLSGLQLCALM